MGPYSIGIHNQRLRFLRHINDKIGMKATLHLASEGTPNTNLHTHMQTHTQKLKYACTSIPLRNVLQFLSHNRLTVLLSSPIISTEIVLKVQKLHNIFIETDLLFN